MPRIHSSYEVSEVDPEVSDALLEDLQVEGAALVRAGVVVLRPGSQGVLRWPECWASTGVSEVTALQVRVTVLRKVATNSEGICAIIPSVTRVALDTEECQLTL